MKLLWAFLVLIIVSGIAQATYINDQAFGLGNGAYITVNTTTIDDVNQLACCDYGLMLRINGSMTNYTAGANKTITSVTYNKVTDTFALPVSGEAGYINFSVIMNNASTSYTLSDGTIKSTQSDKSIWFNYTGSYPVTLTVSKTVTTSSGSSGGGGGSTTITPIPTSTPQTSYGGGKSWSPISYEGLTNFTSPYIEQAKKYLYSSIKPDIVVYVLIFSGLIMFLILFSKQLR